MLAIHCERDLNGHETAAPARIAIAKVAAELSLTLEASVKETLKRAPR